MVDSWQIPDQEDGHVWKTAAEAAGGGRIGAMGLGRTPSPQAYALRIPSSVTA